MTGISERGNVSAGPEVIRVSVLGGRTQLDIALPADVPVTAFLPELARLIGSRDTDRDEPDENAAGRDERRTFWVLSRVDGGAALAPEQTLRAAGIANGELLCISAERALTPPTLYDDVVDAAAQLTRASYAPWDAAAAGVMALAGLWLCSAAWVYLLVSDALAPHRSWVVGGAVLTTVTLAGGAALAHRTLGRADVAAAAGWPVIAISSALGWVVASRYGEYGLAAACAVLLVLTAVYFGVIGTGHWAYLAAAVVFAFGALTMVARAAGWRGDLLAAAAATVAALGTLAAPALTAVLGRFSAPAAPVDEEHEDSPLTVVEGIDSDTAMPSAEEVWARVRSVALARAGLLAGLAAVVAVGAAMLMRHGPGWPALAFALVCVSVLALRARRGRTVAERAALAVPAVALLVIAGTQTQAGSTALRLGGVGVLVVVALAAASAGLVLAGGRLPRWVPTAAAYAEYAAVAGLIPLALWVLGVYDRLGPG